MLKVTMNSLPPQLMTSFLAHEDGVTSASFSLDGVTLATGGYDCAVRLWDTETWQQKQALPGHRRGEVKFSPDGSRLVSGGLHKNASVFDTRTWQVVKTLKNSSGVWALDFRPDGLELILVEPTNWPEERTHRPIELWNTKSWKMTGTADVGVESVYDLAFSPDGQFAAMAHAPSGLISIWSADFANSLTSFSAHHLATWGLSYAPNGQLLATGGADNVARIWDTDSWEVQHELAHLEFKEPTDYKNGVLCTAFSPDGSLLVTGGLDGMLTVWSIL